MIDHLGVVCALGFFFFFNDTATTEIYTLSLHDALPILPWLRRRACAVASRSSASRSGTARVDHCCCRTSPSTSRPASRDRKSTRLNSSHVNISYAVFCLKKKKNYCKKWIIIMIEKSTAQ